MVMKYEVLINRIKEVFNMHDLDQENLVYVMNDLYEAFTIYLKYNQQNEVYRDFKDSYFSLTLLLEELEKTKDFQKYMIMGELKALFMLERYNDIENMDYKKVNEYFEKSNYSKDILKILYKYDGICHNEISRALNISPSNLSNILSRLNKYQFFVGESAGRTTKYYLTEKGSKAIQLLRLQEKNTNVNVKKYIVYDFFDDSEKQNYIINISNNSHYENTISNFIIKEDILNERIIKRRSPKKIAYSTKEI